MNLDRYRHLLSKLPIRHRDENKSVPFILNPNQAIAHEMLKRHYAQTGHIRTIIVKSRRVGMSSYIDALLFCYGLEKPQSRLEIMAHQKSVSEKGLFRVPRDLANGLNAVAENCCEVRTRDIIFNHEDGNSHIDISTAGSAGAGRGMTLAGLHLSEAAQFPGQDSFLGILPAVSKAPDTMIAIESTAFGRTGIGEAFYKFWLSANAKPPKWNGYLPIFLSWLDDPSAVRPESEADDAPATDLERELMKKPFNASRKQIAWMRMVLESECDGNELKFNQEYPHAAHVAFVASDDSAFTKEEMNYAWDTKKEPLRGLLHWSGGKVQWTADRSGKVLIWETPMPQCHYYLGCDCARGIETDLHGNQKPSGDFSAIVVLNGTTGKVAARFADRVDPLVTADMMNMMGRWYNNAMVNIELTGNLGLWAQRVMRDKYTYPNFYVWKGKDDRMPGKQKSVALGFETSARTRDLLFSTFRGKMREGMKGIPGGLELKDEEIIRQMDVASVGMGMRWEVEYGHDDVLFACLLAVIACAQYPPPNIVSYRANVLEKDKTTKLAGLNPQDQLHNSLKRDLFQILRKPIHARTSGMGQF